MLIPANLPRSGAAEFVGRAEAITQLHEMLQQGERVAVSAIAGMGGIGKTELALRYALAYKQTYTGGLCWLQARGGDVDTQLVVFCQTVLNLNPPDGMELADQVKYCWRKWQEGEVLLVFDDVTDYEAIKVYLPPSTEPRFKVLMTTRLRLGRSVKQLELDVLDEAAALELLSSLVERDQIESQLDDAKRLCEQLGYLPLGLELVGRYLARKADLSVASLLKRLSKLQLAARALCKTDTDEDMTAHLGVAEAFELSWSDLSTDAQHLGCGLSLFAAAPIPWSLVKQCFAKERTSSKKYLLPSLLSLLFRFMFHRSVLTTPDPEKLEECRDSELLNLHLLQRVASSTYRLHPLIREFLKNKQNNLAAADKQKYNYCTAMVEVANKMSPTPTLAEITTLTPVIPHLTQAANDYKSWFNNKDLISPFIGLGGFYQGQGAYAQALPWREQCLSVVRQRLGKEHPDVATSYNNLAGLYKDLGRYTEAEPLYQKALALRQRLLGEEHPDVATSYNNLAGLYESLGRYTEAEPLYQQALAFYQRLLGEEHPAVATSYNNLALLYESLGRYTEAEPLYQKALALRQRRLGEEHPAVATSYNNLALFYKDLGRYTEAEPFYQEALALYQRLLGEEHPSVATSYNNLALLYKDLGRYTEAEPLYQQALALRQRRLGEEHPAVATSYNNLALLYKDLGRYTEAEPLYQQALALRQRLLGEEHPDVAESYNGLAALYYSQGRYTEAEPLYQKALEIAELSLGVNHPNTVKIRENLKLLHDEQAEQHSS